MKKKRKSGPGLLSVRRATLLCVLVLAVLLNLAVYALTETFRLYLYTEPAYEHRVSPAVIAGFGEAEAAGDEVEIVFCMPEEDLESDRVYDLVWQTACQLRDALSFVRVRCVNVLTDPGEVERYRTVLTPRGDGTYEEKVVYDLSRDSVVVACEATGSHVAFNMPAFFTLDSRSSITAYRGEEVMAGMIRYALSETHPACYLPSGHGESAPAGLYELLVCAGYELCTIDLLTETPTDTSGLLVLTNPLYDYCRGGAGVEAEIEKLERYTAEGGMVLALLDPLAAFDGDGQCKLPNLVAWMAGRGLRVTSETVRDAGSAVTADGYTLLAEYPEGAGGTVGRTAARIREANGARLLLRECARVEVSDVAGLETGALLVTSASGRTYSGTQATEARGPFAVAGLSRDLAGGGTLALVCSYYVGADDALGSDDWGNSSFFYGLLEETRGRGTPLGATKLPFDSTLLRDLTRREARLWALCLTLLPALAAAAAGTVILHRRREK